MRDLAVTYLAIGDLEPCANNPRTHSKKQTEQIAASIRAFGFTNPILVDEFGGVIAGHGRLDAAKLMGLDRVPTIRLDDLSEAQIRAYVIADNKLAENAGWDDELLALELQGLIDLDFDVMLTGFEMGEVDVLIDGLDAGAASDPADQTPDVDETSEPVSRLGDLWLLGPHKLLCADATSPESYLRLLSNADAQMVFADPPYNVPISGHVSSLGAVNHPEFAMASGEMSRPEFTRFLKRVFDQLAFFSSDGSIHFHCMDWRHLGEMLDAANGVYTELKNLCIWNKTNAGMGALYRSKHELVFVFKNGRASHVNNVELGKHGRYRTNVWDYAGANTFGRDRDEALAMHPTVKPVALVADAIKDCSNRGGLILDPFAGSGTTIIAADKTGRVAAAIELDPIYVDVAIKRWQHLTGGEAVHAETDMTFEQMRVQRAKEDPLD